MQLELLPLPICGASVRDEPVERDEPDPMRPLVEQAITSNVTARVPARVAGWRARKGSVRHELLVWPALRSFQFAA